VVREIDPLSHNALKYLDFDAPDGTPFDCERRELSPSFLARRGRSSAYRLALAAAYNCPMVMTLGRSGCERRFDDMPPTRTQKHVARI
jgi:hypothetical protein